MKSLFTFLAVAGIFTCTDNAALAQPSSLTVGNTTLDVRVIIQGTNSSNGIDVPWEIQWGPDDHIWMTERYGRVSRLDPETGNRFTILDISGSIYNISEAGLLGMQLHPDFSTNPYVYLAYTYSAGEVMERIERYTYNSISGMLESPMTLLEEINGNFNHSGCRLLILPDNTLLVSTGDYLNQASPQNPNSLNGKVLRMNLDGSIPSDNPFGPTSYVYSMGHRNPQGLLLAPNGSIYSSEHGPSTNDELNIIEGGGNYGWPEVEGFCNLSNELTACASMTDYQDPVTVWYESSTIAPSDLVWYDHPAIPEWQGKMLMTVLKGEHLKAIELDLLDGTTVISQEIFFNDAHTNDPSSSFDDGIFDRLRDVCVAPDGRVFLATNGSSWAAEGPFTHAIVELKNPNYLNVGELQRVHTTIWPNPSNGHFRIVFPEQLLSGNFILTDMTGRTVKTGHVSHLKMTMDLSFLSAGSYLLNVLSDNHVSIERLVVSE